MILLQFSKNGNSHQSDESNVLIFTLLAATTSAPEDRPPSRTRLSPIVYDAYGMRNCVAAVIVMRLQHGCGLVGSLLLADAVGVSDSRIVQTPPSLVAAKCRTPYKLPGGRIRPGESDGRGPEWEECTKLFLVKLPASRRFIVPKNFRLLAIPLCQLHENEETYGPIISESPVAVQIHLQHCRTLNFLLHTRSNIACRKL
ncbi:hypothetical protein DH2020_014263 [Rehmannia glutinosa]|uniref:Uncharacterized protein n=1 Tax=Rehmannia glutinosa TaxID=99300 RepID=A0ABR0WVV1_REHGL